VARRRGSASTRTARASLALLGVASFLGCSADALETPEPQVDTPGAIVGIEDETLGVVMMRTQATTGTGMGEPILLVDILNAEPRSFEEARALARGPDLPVRTFNYFITLRTVLTNPHEVLWFRSLPPR
jgi:hypothetical protein